MAFKEFGRHRSLPGFDVPYFPDLQKLGIDFANNSVKSWQSPSFSTCQVIVINRTEASARSSDRWQLIHRRSAACEVHEEMMEIVAKSCPIW